MSKVYINQTNLTISLDTGETLTNVTTALIKYKKPDGTSGQWTATASGQSVSYAVSAGNLNVSGRWTIWAHITFANGKTSIGEPSVLTVYQEGQ